MTLDELRYVTVSFWGFDDTAHTGELIVHRDAADGMVQVFGQLFAARFPIEDMRVSSMADLDAPHTGDGNTTAAFVCRPTRGSSRGRSTPTAWPSTSTRSRTRTSAAGG